MPKTPKVTAWHLAIISYWSNCANLAFQALSFLAALISLSTKETFIPPKTIVTLEAFGLPLLMAASGFVAISKIRIRRLELAEKTSTPKKTLDSNTPTVTTNGYKGTVKLRVGSPRFYIEVYRKEGENKSLFARDL